LVTFLGRSQHKLPPDFRKGTLEQEHRDVHTEVFNLIFAALVLPPLPEPEAHPERVEHVQGGGQA
jgi:hypothetical protein